MNLQTLLEKFDRGIKWVTSLNWRKPVPWLVVGSLVLFPMVAKYLVLTALMMAILIAISTLIVVDHLPLSVKKVIRNHPSKSNLIMTFLSMITIMPLMGSGLTVTMCAIFNEVILEFTTPLVVAEEKIVELA